jgi:hypothetical protein
VNTTSTSRRSRIARPRATALAIVGVMVLLLITTVSIGAQSSDSPSDVRAVALSTSEIELSWEIPEGVEVSGIRIERNQQTIATVEPGTTRYIDDTVQASSAYTYRISLLDASGKASPPATENVKTPAPPETTDRLAPSPPEALTVTRAKGGGVQLDWYDSSDDTDVTAYRIYRNGEVLATVNNGTLSFLDEEAPTEGSVEYAVEAWDPAGNSSERTQASLDESEPEDVTSSPVTAAEEPTIQATSGGYASQLTRYPYLTDVVDRYTTINWSTDRSATS